MPDPAIDGFFEGRETSRRLFEAVALEVACLDGVTVRVSKSQVAFRRRRNFALVWIPGQYLKGRSTAPLVLTLSFPQRDPSPRWKEITEIGPGRFTHHLELYGEADIDAEVCRWLQAAWEHAA